MSDDLEQVDVILEEESETLDNSELTYELTSLRTRVEELALRFDKADIEEQRAQLFTPHIKKIYRFCVICSGVLLSLIIADGISCIPFEMDKIALNTLIVSTGLLMWRLLLPISEAVLKQKP